jgi:hypothetical protein
MLVQPLQSPFLLLYLPALFSVYIVRALYRYVVYVIPYGRNWKIYREVQQIERGVIVKALCP